MDERHQPNRQPNGQPKQGQHQATVLERALGVLLPAVLILLGPPDVNPALHPKHPAPEHHPKHRHLLLHQPHRHLQLAADPQRDPHRHALNLLHSHL